MLVPGGATRAQATARPRQLLAAFLEDVRRHDAEVHRLLPHFLYRQSQIPAPTAISLTSGCNAAAYWLALPNASGIG